MRNHILTLAITVLSLVSMCLGCGGNTGPDMGTVSGTLTKGGEPVPQGWIEFHPVAGGRPSFATTDDQGNYSLTYTADQQGALIGMHEVKAGTGGIDSPDGRSTTKQVPFKFKQEVEVTSGSNTIDIQVE